MIKAIIFDCFGVLYSDGKSYIKNLCPAEKRQELSDLYYQMDYGYISTKKFFQEISQIVHVDAEKLRKVNLQQYTRNEQIIELLKELKNKYKIGLLSNVGDDFLDSLFPQEEQEEFFDAMVLSSHIGAIKPYVEIYEAIAEKLEVKPEECIMIDDIPGNCEGARQAGMQAIHYENVEETRQQLKQLIEVK